MRLITILLLLNLPQWLAAAERPNFLVIAVDDLNDWIGCLKGHPQVKTPNIDRLAARGTLFSNAHCQAPLCNPSRTSILTGLRPSTTGIYALAPWFRTVAEFKDRLTLPQALQKSGYRTLTCGKIHHDAYPPKEDRVDGREFSVWGYHGSFGPRPKVKFVKTPDDIAAMDWGVFPAKDEDMEDWKVADWAVGRLRAKPKQPFALWVGIRHPHVPCFATQKWFDWYPEDKLILPPVKDDDRDDLPRFASYLHWKLPEPRLQWLKKADQWKPLVRSYLASISFADAMIGRVLDALKENGLEENTVVVLWSDHGWHLGEKGITGKNSLWERSTRVPLIFAGPGIAAGAECKRPVELLDLYPTLLELAGLAKDEKLEGLSLLPQLKDAQAPRERPALTTHNRDNHAVRTEHWRYIRYADGSEELYDEVRDPNEWKNLAGEKDLVKIKTDLAKWMPKKNAAAAAGSAGRLLQVIDGKVYWEGKEVGPNDVFPAD